MSFRRKTIAGIKWTTVATVTTTVSTILKTSVLARFLDKSDFGLMALVVFVIGFTNLFMDMGLTAAILHKQEITNREYNSLYWLNIIFSFILFFLLSMASSFVSSFYSEPELTKLIPLMASTIIISGIGRQFKTIEQKHLNFKFICIVEVIASISALIFAVILAINDFGIYSLVYPAILLQVIANIAFFFKGVKRVGLKLHFKMSDTKPFLKIGIFKAGGQIINYINRDLDILLIGKLMGSEVLGGYSLAKELARKPLKIINPIILKVYSAILPGYQNNKDRLRFYFSKIIHNVSIINAIIYGSIAILSPVLIRIFYGEGFDDINLILIGFCLIMYLRSSELINVLVIVTGRTDLEFYWNIFNLLFFPIVIYFGASYSIYHIVLFIAITQIAFLLPCWIIFYKESINLKLKVFLINVLQPLSICLIIFFFFYTFNYYLFIDMPSIYKQGIFAFILIFNLGLYIYYFSDDMAKLLKLKK